MGGGVGEIKGGDEINDGLGEVAADGFALATDFANLIGRDFGAGHHVPVRSTQRRISGDQMRITLGHEASRGPGPRPLRFPPA